ncbi:hypothetical protein [uncultured Dubosiella sp.]|uniref:hypothetical protein n=1 Tax=uncultured Dubosiella sp. TaxID=1937011 RepID=UPI002592F1D5|nr:hypothetical protein [uncultured Dubosiella sp.]
MKAREIVSYIHQNMQLTFRPEDTVECHASILKEWSRNDALLPTHEVDVLRLKYDDTMGGFHDLNFIESRFLDYVEKAEQDEEEDVYFSLNSFWSVKRTEEDIRHLNAFAIDYDFYKIKKYADLTPAEMYVQHIQPSLPIEPTFVIDSGRGLYCVFCIEHTPYQCTDVYKAIYSYMVESQKEFGADAKASLSTQVIRVPGSLNSRSGRIVKVIEHKDVRYTIPYLASIFLPYTRSQVLEHKRKKLQSVKKVKVARKGNRLKSNLATFEKDLIALIQLRNEVGIQSGYRETLLYLYWERAQKIEIDEEAIRKKILWLNSLFSVPLRQKEALKRCRPARVYQFVTSRSKALQKLEITAEEQAHLSFLVGAQRSASMRKKKSRKKGLVRGRTKAAQARHERRKSILIGFAQGMTAAALAKELGVTKKTILADCKYISTHIQEFIHLIETLKRSLANRFGQNQNDSRDEGTKGVRQPIWGFLT